MSAGDFLRSAADRLDLNIGATADGLDEWDHGFSPDPTGTLRTGSLDEPDPSTRATRLAAVISANRRGVIVRIPGRHLDDVNVLVRAGVEAGAPLLDGLVAEDGYAYLIWSDRAVPIEPSTAQLMSCRVRELIGDSVDRAEEARSLAEADVARLSADVTT
ncbi:MAG TPA: hypothetical protein VE175_07000, partial [Woeseiaceae bacterium]|nr:hypothetical protein [Woeseiaceae bacterium]